MRFINFICCKCNFKTFKDFELLYLFLNFVIITHTNLILQQRCKKNLSQGISERGLLNTSLSITYQSTRMINENILVTIWIYLNFHLFRLYTIKLSFSINVSLIEFDYCFSNRTILHQQTIPNVFSNFL